MCLRLFHTLLKGSGDLLILNERAASSHLTLNIFPLLFIVYIKYYRSKMKLDGGREEMGQSLTICSISTSSMVSSTISQLLTAEIQTVTNLRQMSRRTNLPLCSCSLSVTRVCVGTNSMCQSSSTNSICYSN